MARRTIESYWLRGEEVCRHCLQPYAYAIERRCVVCDGPACPHCVTIVHTAPEVVCVICASEQPSNEEE